MTTKTYTGIVVQIIGNRVRFKTTSAAVYDAETSASILTRKNGAPMEFKDILVGDKVAVKGSVWPDNSMNASTIRNLSLYAHHSTFSGKITAIDSARASFTMQSRAQGLQVVQTNPLTGYKKNNSAATVQDLKVGVTVKVKGTWERTSGLLNATVVSLTVRLVRVEITGQLVMKNTTAITVVAQGVIYGVDITSAKLFNARRKPITFAELTVGGDVRVLGKHIPEGVDISGSIVREIAN